MENDLPKQIQVNSLAIKNHAKPANLHKQVHKEAILDQDTRQAARLDHITALARNLSGKPKITITE
jgi:hypothetical protein